MTKVFASALRTIAVALAVLILVPTLLFVVVISIQEGCLLCFEGEGRGSVAEVATNVVLAALVSFGIFKAVRKYL